MKKTAIITLAGCSTRFSQSIGKECLKALYTEKTYRDCLLSMQLEILSKNDIEKIILVGGYKYNELTKFIKKHYPNKNIELVYNPHFKDYGSCYSLVKGIEALPDENVEVTFIEGDLLFDENTFRKVVESEKDAVTVSPDLIKADTSVVFYVSNKHRLRYVYDKKHKTLEITEPFILVGNSGQVWKFKDSQKLKKTLERLTEKDYKDTNLIPINDYYDSVDYRNIEFVVFKKWYNCNTISDYKSMMKGKG